VELPTALVAHLESWIGAWPPPSSGVTIVEANSRVEPEWDGRVRPVRGVRTPDGTVIGVPPGGLAEARSAGATVEELKENLPTAMGFPGWRIYEGVFRWSDDPIPFDAPGSWHAPDESMLPDWLRPFNAPVLVVIEEGVVVAGVGRKVHDPHGQELAVVTDAEHRGKGLAKRLVSQAAFKVIEEGAIPTYLHAPGNEASARTADASGFPDRGWSILGLYPGSPG
jgi:GNAT superfamily N-acetyltransferase